MMASFGSSKEFKKPRRGWSPEPVCASRNSCKLYLLPFLAIPSLVSPFFSSSLLPSPLALSSRSAVSSVLGSGSLTAGLWERCKLPQRGHSERGPGHPAEPRPQSQFRYILRRWNVSCGNDFGSVCGNQNIVTEAYLSLHIFQGRASALSCPCKRAPMPSRTSLASVAQRIQYKYAMLVNKTAEPRPSIPVSRWALLAGRSSQYVDTWGRPPTANSTCSG